MLDYSAHAYPHCETEDKTAIIRWGYTTCLILLNDVSEYQTYLRLKEHRFFCQSCKRSFVAETSLVEKYCSISNKVKLSTADRLRKMTSMSEIAHQKKVSVSSVYRVLKRFYEPKKINRLTLPEVLYFDEFKSIKQVAASMSLIMIDGQTKQSTAQIILDRFHIVQLIGQTFLKQRIQRMDTFLHRGKYKNEKIATLEELLETSSKKAIEA